jgi:hypothetical protein
MCYTIYFILSKKIKIPFVTDYFIFLLFMSLGAHIGPEPTTDRFVVVMVCTNASTLDY